MTNLTRNIIADYEKERERLGKEKALITENRGWISLNGRKYRPDELQVLTHILKYHSKGRKVN